MRALLFAVTMTLSTVATAAELTIERILADPALSGPAPRTLKIAPDGSLVTFLRGKATDQNQLDLWAYDVERKATRLLVDSARLAPKAVELSDEEKARRERQRIANFAGIVEYEFAADGRRLLFPLGGDLYLYDLAARPAKAVRQLTHGEGFATDAKISPKGRYVSFIRDRAVWVVDLDKDTTRRVSPEASATVAYGVAEFVADEEMDRHTGYWWAPDDSAIAYTRFDEANVPLQRRFEIYADRTEVVEQRYPAAGETNVDIALFVASLDRAGEPAHAVDLGADKDIYLARVDWLPDGRRLAFQRQTRNQRRLDLVLHDTRDGTQRTLLTEVAPTYVNLHNDLRFVDDGARFLWSSERNGVRQLELHALDGAPMRTLTPASLVVDAVLGLDRKRRTVYFSGHPDDAPLGKSVYAIALDGGEGASGPSADSSATVREITARDGWHEAVFSRDASVFVDTWNDATTPPQVRLHRADGRELAVLEANRVDADHPYAPYMPGHRKPEFGTLTGNDGQLLHYRVLKPAGFDASRKYPVIIRVYGGPHAQVVANVWDARWGFLDQYFARRGYVVFSLDNRGAARRGKAFEEALYRRMGELEVVDQLEGVAWLGQQPWVDAKRIGVYGWSYGGYMTLLLLAKASDRIAAGAAGAPVTDWRLYDTHYTERYMDLPDANPDGYAASNVLAHVDGLKSPLLLVHGMADDNVLFTHSTKLMTALQGRGVPFELMTYPGEKHSLANVAMKRHAYETIARFFDRQLRPDTP